MITDVFKADDVRLEICQEMIRFLVIIEQRASIDARGLLTLAYVILPATCILRSIMSLSATSKRPQLPVSLINKVDFR